MKKHGDQKTTYQLYSGVLIDCKVAGLLALASLITLSSCSEPPPYIPPKAGEVVTWKHSSELIIKTKLGQRREHVPNRLDDLIYEPEYERYVGQFPVDYVPERFAKFTTQEQAAFEADYDKKLHAVKSQHFIEFSLMLNGAKGKVTDTGFYGNLDNINQIRVLLQHLRKDEATTERLYEPFPMSQKVRYNKQSSDEYGLECYTEEENSRLWCFGKSSYNKVFGYSFTLMGDDAVWVQSREPIYGGIYVQWRIHLKNLKHWKEADAAIWRLLESWNVSTLDTKTEN